MFAPKKILVPTNLSEHSDAALRKAIEIAGQYNAKIYLLHVFDSNLQGHLEKTGMVPDEFFETIKAMRAEYLQEMIRRQRETYVPARNIEIIPEVKSGIPDDVILKEQQKKGVDLVVLGSHKKTGLVGQFLSSVAERVLRGASFPALVVSY